MNDKIEFLKQKLPQLRQVLLHKSISDIQTKENSFSNIVTDLDLFIQNELTTALKSAFPESVFLTEEAYRTVSGDCLWIIDPIDGTKNFYRRQEDYAISVAYYEHGRPGFGFVYDIAKDLLYLGIHGQGAWVNGIRIPPIKPKSLQESVLDMNLRTLYAYQARGANIQALNEKIFAHRSIGSGALSLCRIATGAHDIYLSSGVMIWDYAAAKIILEEAGGLVVLPDEREVPLDNRSVALWACTSSAHYDAIMNTLYPKP